MNRLVCVLARWRVGAFARSRVGGFTLVELLVTATILGVVSVAIISSFSHGLRIYKRVQDYAAVKTDALLALEKMERDVRNTFPYAAIDFFGDREQISFAGFIRDEDGQPGIGRIIYYTGGTIDTMMREEQHYAKATREFSKHQGNVASLVPVRKLRFAYYYFDKEEKRYEWKDSWGSLMDEESEEKQPSTLPLGIRVELTYDDGGSDVTLARTILIPVASNNASR